MKKHQLFDVQLVNFTNFQPYEGAKQFEDEFKSFANTRLTYKFYDEKNWFRAEKRLNELNLKYTKTYGIELESEKEIQNHPAFFISFSSVYNTIEKKEGKVFVNSSKIGKRNFQRDTKENIFVVTEKAKIFFEEKVPNLKFEELMSDKSSKKFYKLENIPFLDSPILFKYVRKMEKREEEVYSYQSDGRVSLEEQSLNELKIKKMCISKMFSIDEKTYNSIYELLIVSGEFIIDLKKTFDFSSDDIIINPFTMDTL